ncbi:hypothetical protein EB796_001861 [Bugula neritina]|uniref:Uncharacterized protein n=1 Tax=Bugula neritina TaxID=10212 RepID=A0A7J7KNZ3_BUGNE|nr:hypothetical protein EB796_001861 [Bugula neritina]
MAVINWLSFVLLIPLSCVACCGTCNRTPNNGTIGQTTVITAGPPGYMNSPPHNPYSVPMQQYPPAAPAYAAAMPQYSGYPQQTEAGQTPQKY